MHHEPFLSERVVLCVDDDEAMLRMVRTYLEAHDYAVLTETSGRAAIQEALNAHSLYAVVLDYTMPGLSGDEISAAIRQARPEIPIIMFSGSIEKMVRDAHSNVDIVVDKQQGMDALLRALGAVGKPPVTKFAVRRKFLRYAVNLPIVVAVERSGRTVTINGVATSLGEGGIGSRLDAELLPGEVASIAIMNQQLASLCPRAQLRYRHNEVYGFAFVELNESHQRIISQSCARLASG